jgi:hypothetical protein
MEAAAGQPARAKSLGCNDLGGGCCSLLLFAAELFDFLPAFGVEVFKDVLI